MALSLDDLLADPQESDPKPKIRLDDLLAAPGASGKIGLDDLLGPPTLPPIYAGPPARGLPTVEQWGSMPKVGPGMNELLANELTRQPTPAAIDPTHPTRPPRPVARAPLLPTPDYGTGMVTAGRGTPGAIAAGVGRGLLGIAKGVVSPITSTLSDVFSPSTPEEAANPLQQAARMRFGQSIPEVQAGVHEARLRAGQGVQRPGERTAEMVKSLPRMGYDVQSAMSPGPNLGNLLYDALTGRHSSQELIDENPQALAAQFEPGARAEAFTGGVGLPILLGMGAHGEYARGMNPDAARGVWDRATGRYPPPPPPPVAPPALVGPGRPPGYIGAERQLGNGDARFSRPVEGFAGDQPLPRPGTTTPAEPPFTRAAERRVAELEQQLAAERRVSRTEPRTGLGNALQLQEAEAANPAHHWGAVDVVGLKGLNDKVSYKAGTELIHQVASAMKQAATEFGIPMQHVHFSGGDEGWVNHEDPRVVQQFTDRVRQLVPSATIPGTSFPTGVRVGSGPSRGAADEAVRLAKDAEQGRYIRPEYQGPGGERRGIDRRPEQQDIVRFPTADIKAKPETYQFKQLGATGVSGELKNVTKFNEELGGAISVWREPQTGDVVVINGHHRLDLAKRLGHPSLNVHFIKAGSVEEARAKGAFQNIAEGRGTPLDVAKFLRDTKVTPDALRARGVSLDARLANDGLHLSKLAPDLFDQVATGKVKMGWGVAIGEMVKSPDLQRQALSAASAARPRLTTAEVRELARAIESTGSEQVEQGGLFGGTLDESLFVHRARLAALVQKRLAGDKRLFGYIAKEGRASELERAGDTKIDVNAAADIAGNSARIQEIFSRLYTRSGPIADVMSEGARRVAHGEKAPAVARDLYPAIGAAVEAELRNAPTGGVSGLGGGGAERPEAPRPVPTPAPEAPLAPGPDTGLSIDEASPYADNEGNEEPFLAGARDDYHGYLAAAAEGERALESGKSPYTNRKLTARQLKEVQRAVNEAREMAANVLEEIRSTFGNEVADQMAAEAEGFSPLERSVDPDNSELVFKADQEAVNRPPPKTAAEKRVRALSDDALQAEAEALIESIHQMKAGSKPLQAAADKLDLLRVEVVSRRPGGNVPYPGTESDPEWRGDGIIENPLDDMSEKYQPTEAGRKQIRAGEPNLLPSTVFPHTYNMSLNLQHVTGESLDEMQSYIEDLFDDPKVKVRLKRNPGLVELLENDNDAIALEKRIRLHGNPEGLPKPGWKPSAPASPASPAAGPAFTDNVTGEAGQFPETMFETNAQGERNPAFTRLADISAKIKESSPESYGLLRSQMPKVPVGMQNSIDELFNPGHTDQALKFYRDFAPLRRAIRDQVGTTVRLWRSQEPKKQIGNKHTLYYAATKSGAQKYATRTSKIVFKDVPVEDIVAGMFYKKSGYHELVVLNRESKGIDPALLREASPPPPLTSPAAEDSDLYNPDRDAIKARFPDASEDALDAIEEADGDINAAIDALDFDDARGTGYKSDDGILAAELEDLRDGERDAEYERKQAAQREELRRRYPTATEWALTMLERNGGDLERAIKDAGKPSKKNLGPAELIKLRGGSPASPAAGPSLADDLGLSPPKEERAPDSQDPDQGVMFSRVPGLPAWAKGASQDALTVLEENGGDLDAAIRAMSDDDPRGSGYSSEEVLFELEDMRDVRDGGGGGIQRSTVPRDGFELTSEPVGPEQPSMFGEREGTPAARSLSEAEAAARAKIDQLRQRLQHTTDPDRRAKLSAELAQQLKLVNRGQGIGHEEGAADARAAANEQAPADRGQQDLFASKATPGAASQGTPETRAQARGGRGKAAPGRRVAQFPVAVDEALAGQKGILKWLQHTFAPTSMTVNSRWTAEMIRDVDARREARVVRAYEALRYVATAFDRMPLAERLDFIYRMEAGEPQLNPQTTWFAELLRKMLDDKRDAIQALGTGKLETFYEHYFPHLWKDPKRAGNWIARFLGNRPLEGSKAFLKERSVPTVKAGVEMGLEPATTNPVDLVMLKLAEMDKYLASQDILRNLKKQGLAKYVSVFSKIPNGWTKYNDPTSTVWGPPTVQVWEAFDQLVRRALTARIAEIGRAKGIRHTRETNIGMGAGTAGWADMGPGNEMKTKFGGPDSVIMHELGHLLDKHWKLWPRLMDAPGKTRAAIDLRKRLNQEMRDLADLRVEGTHPDQVSKSHRRYLHNEKEKVANAVAAIIYAPEKMRAVAPTIMARLTEVFNSDPLLKPLLDIKPSMTLGIGVAEQPIGGMPVRGYWLVPNTVGTILNNHLSAGLASNPLYTAYRGAGNVLNMAQLGLSAFHLGFTSLDAMISKTAVAFRYLEHGQWVEAVKHLAQMPTASVTNFLQGRQLLKAYLQPGQMTPEMASILDGLLKGGGRVQMDPFYRTGASRRFLEALRGAPERVQVGTGAGGAPMYGLVAKRHPTTALVNALPAFFEQTSRWLMEYIVPRQKLGVFMDMYRFELARLGPSATEAEVRHAAVKVWNSVDNRMGQLVYNNLFWHRTLKDLGMASVRSLGWNLGSVSEVGGGLVDTATMPKRLYGQRGPRFGGKQGKAWGTGEESILTHKQTYIAALVFTVGLFNAIVQYLYTGGPPREMKDLFFPRTGRKTPEGDDERLSPASYIRDIASVAHGGLQAVTHKLHPLLSFISDMVQNEDFFGNQLRNPQAPAVVQLKQLMEAAAGEFAPFSIQQYLEEKRRGQSQVAATSSFFGLTPAPRYVVRTPAKNLMAEILKTRSAHGLSPEDVAAQRARGQVLQGFRAGDPNAPTALEEAIRGGTMTPGQTTRMLGRVAVNPVVERFKQLTASEAVSVFALANEEERQLWIEALIVKIENAANEGDYAPATRLGDLLRRHPMTGTAP